jgi:hypothetical protein
VLMNLSFGQRGFRANFAPSRVTRWVWEKIA